MTSLAWEALQRGDDLPDLDELAGLAEQQQWRADAACREHPELPWVPGRGVSMHVIDEMKAICAACLVRDECASYAGTFTVAELHGIWAGSSGRDRRVRLWPSAA